jgi:hypothetical protein
MDSQKFQELLTLASRHLVEARLAIRKQEKRINEMLKQGVETTEARALLEKLRASSEAMAEHHREIERQIRSIGQDKHQG